MVRYQCKICKKYFSTRGGLTQHANAVHQGRTVLTSSQPHHEPEPQEVIMPEYNTDLWSTPIRMRPPSETDTSSQPHQSQVAMPEYNTDL